MMKNNNQISANISLADRFINALLSVAMSFCISFQLITMLRFSTTKGSTLFILLLFTLVAFLLLYNKITTRFTLIAFSAIVFVAAMGWLLSPSLRGSCIRFIGWLKDYILGNVNLDQAYVQTTVLLICLFVAFYVYAMIINRLWFIPIVLGAALFVVATQQMLAFSDFAFYTFDIAALLFYFRTIYQHNSKKGHNRLIKQWGGHALGHSHLSDGVYGCPSAAHQPISHSVQMAG